MDTSAHCWSRHCCPVFPAARARTPSTGGAFSVQAKATTLVTTGLYARIRNPIYVFGCLMITGIIIWLQKPWFLLCFVILIPMQVIRSRKEARVLEEKFGAAYQDYKLKTWF